MSDMILRLKGREVQVLVDAIREYLCNTAAEASDPEFIQPRTDALRLVGTLEHHLRKEN
jgi:hypothetical protein